jgi:hypothetical protein
MKTYDDGGRFSDSTPHLWCCDIHKCGSRNGYVDESSMTFCKDHRCIVDGCRNDRMCNDHTCHMIGCHNHVVYDRFYGVIGLYCSGHQHDLDRGSNPNNQSQ